MPPATLPEPAATARPGTPTWLRSAAALWIALLAAEALMLGMLRAVPSADTRLPIYFELLRRHDAVALPLYALVGVAAIAFAATGRSAAGPARWCAAHPALLALASLAVHAFGAIVVYHAGPLCMDEYLPLFQSKVFAAGQLHGTVPPDLVDAVVGSEFQNYFFSVNRETGALSSRYWPAFALLLAPFSAAGAEWLFNPLVTAATVLALDSLLRKLPFDETARGLALLTTVTASAIAINATSLYAMPLLLLCNVVFTRLMLEGSSRAWFAAGVVGSIGLTAINPVPHALYALPWLLRTALRPGEGLRALAWVAAGYLPLSIVLGFGWPAAYHHFAPEQAAANVGNVYASMVRVFDLPSVEILVARAYAIVKLDLWGIPGLLPLALAGMFAWRGAIPACLRWSVLLTFAGYLFVPADQGHGWGYRYFHQAWTCLPILAIGALRSSVTDARARRRAESFLAAACVGALVLLLPLRATQVEGFISAHRAQLPARVSGNATEVVFVDVRCGYYSADLVQNDPFLRGNELRFVSKDQQADYATAARFIADPVVIASTPCARRWGTR